MPRRDGAGGVSGGAGIGGPSGRSRESSLQRVGRPGHGGAMGLGGSGVRRGQSTGGASAERSGGGRKESAEDRSLSATVSGTLRNGGSGPLAVVATAAAIPAMATPARSNSLAALAGDSGGYQGIRGGSAEELAHAVALLQRDLDDSRRENARLQEKLCKAKNLMVLVQKQADDARAERDRERLKAESLQKSSQQLMRQLKRESAKVSVLERKLAMATREEPVYESGKIAEDLINCNDIVGFGGPHESDIDRSQNGYG